MPTYRDDLPTSEFDAGDLFNYAVWNANTEITLCNVPWDSAYKDVVHFESTNALNEYIDSIGDTTSITNAMYARVNEPISIDMPFGRAMRYNYVRVYNPAQPVSGNDVPRYYYYFIRGIRHASPNTTEIAVQLDEWQSHIRQIQFGRAYIERGHIGIANEKRDENYGRSYLTIPEGLNLGTDYVTVAANHVKIMDSFNNNGASNPEPTFNILAISTTDLNGDHGTEREPKNPSAKPTLIQGGIPSGAGVYIWENASDFMAFLNDFSKKPWVTSGIVSITLIPDIRRYRQFGITWSSAKDPVTRAYTGYPVPRVRRNLFPNWRKSQAVLNYIPERYRHLSKLLTSPYCMLEMTFNAGSAVVLKPESWNSRDASVLEMMNIIPPAQRIGIAPLNYNGRNETPDGPEGLMSETTPWQRDGDYLDMAVFLSSFPTIPIVNNGQIQSLAASARSIAASYASNDWSQSRALAGNQLSYDQASNSIQTGRDLANNAMSGDANSTAIANNLASQQALLNMVGGIGSGVGMGAFAGPVGAVGGGAGAAISGALNMAGTGMNIDASNAQLANRLSGAGAARDISANSAMYIRDTNKELADWAAKGDYANARAQLDARVQDAAMLPHGMSGQFGGETFNLVNDEMRLSLRVKMIDQAAISVVGEYWLRYGYPVRRSANIPNDLRVMDRFSYWKLSEVYIRTGNFSESTKRTIAGILEKGVTVWNAPQYVGNIDFADNRPLRGIVIDGYNPPEWEPEPDPIRPVIKRKRKKMIVFAVNDGGMKYALAGASPGTDANWIETESQGLMTQWLSATGATEPVVLDPTGFYAMEAAFKSPVKTQEIDGGI